MIFLSFAADFRLSRAAFLSMIADFLAILADAIRHC